MERLKTTFTKNGLPYTLIQRNDVVALYGVGGTYPTDILHYEVCRIQHLTEREMFSTLVPAHEALPSNEQFGKEGSRAIVKLDEARKYFDALTKRLNIANKAPESA